MNYTKHLVEPKELEWAEKRKSDEKWLRELQALHYEGEPSAEEKKRILRESRSSVGRNIRYNFVDDHPINS